MRQDGKSGFAAAILAVIILAVLLFLIIYTRELKGNSLYPNGQSYYNLRIAREISQNPFFSEDKLQGTVYYPSAYHYALAFSIMWVGEAKTAYFMPMVLGVIFAILFMWLLESLGFSKSNATFAAFLLAVTPPYIIVFTTLALEGFTAILSILVLSLYFEKNYWDFPWKISGKISFALSIIFLAILAVTSLVGFAVTLIFMLALSSLKGRGFKSLAFAATPPLLIFIPLAIFTDYLRAAWNGMGFGLFSIREAFSIFGAEMGLGIFLLLLFLTGLVIIWSLLKSLRLYHIMSILLVAASLFNPLLRVYASLVILVYAVIAIKNLYYTKWELDVAKTGTIILVACALVFSSLSQITELVNAEPGAQAMSLINELGKEPGGIVLSSPEFGFLIQEHAGKKTYLDASSSQHDDYPRKLDVYLRLMQASRITDAKPILDAEGISYIMITPEMKRVLWSGKEQGFLLLARNSASFEKVFSSNDFEAWKYNPD